MIHYIIQNNLNYKWRVGFNFQPEALAIKYSNY